MSQETTKPLTPAWTEDDFYSDAVYVWLWEHRDDNKFIFQRYLTEAQRQAKRLHVSGFLKVWNAYVQSMSPKVTVMGNNVTQFSEQPVELACGQYECNSGGVYYTGRLGEDIEVIKHPLMPVRRVVNVDTGQEKIQLAFNRGAKNKWSDIIVPMDVVSSAQKIVSLSNAGIGVNSENAREVVKYIAELEHLNYNDLPVQNSTSHLGWTAEGEFSPYSGDLVYDGESPECQRLFAQITQAGSEQVWLDAMRTVRSGTSVPARIALAASFAAPLISLVNGLSFFCHFWGLQGTGKTVGLMVGASVWGKPELGGYIKNFGGTKVSHEVNAAFCCNIPVFMDELQVVADRKSFDDMIYMLCEGFSKGRGSKDGGLQAQRRWSTCFLTTGEMPIVQSNSGGGAVVRVLEVPYGGEPFFPDPRKMASIVGENYGWAGPRFIDALRDRETLESVRALQQQYYDTLNGDVEAKQVLAASIILAADKLAEQVIFGGDGRALTVEDIKPFMVTKEQADANRRCYEYLLGVIAANPLRFDATDNKGELWGVIEGDYAYINKVSFDQMLAGSGFSANAFLTWAKRKNKLKFEDFGDSNKRLTVRRTINGRRTTCIALLINDDVDEATRLGFSVDSGELPF